MKKIITPAILVAILLALVASCLLPINGDKDAKTQYFCDYHPISIGMSIGVEDTEGNKLYEIDGELFNHYEDDLTMHDKNGNVVMETKDDYNFISQNNHAIMKDNNVLYNCNGKFKLFADSYVIYDADGNEIAQVKFNMFDTNGTMIDNNGDTIATYKSRPFRKDYAVSIFDECEIEDEAILLMFASYVSDLRADSN